jgi:hypothetical protein
MLLPIRANPNQHASAHKLLSGSQVTNMTEIPLGIQQPMLMT